MLRPTLNQGILTEICFHFNMFWNKCYIVFGKKKNAMAVCFYRCMILFFTTIIILIKITKIVNAPLFANLYFSHAKPHYKSTGAYGITISYFWNNLRTKPVAFVHQLTMQYYEIITHVCIHKLTTRPRISRLIRHHWWRGTWKDERNAEECPASPCTWTWILPERIRQKVHFVTDQKQKWVVLSGSQSYQCQWGTLKGWHNYFQNRCGAEVHINGYCKVSPTKPKAKQQT